MAPETAGITLRRAGLSDIPAIVAVQARSWRASYRGLVDDDFLDRLPMQDWIASWRTHFFSEHGDVACFLAEEGGRVVGFASAGGASESPQLGPAVGELHTIYIDGDRYGTGLGRRLMDAALDHLREHGFSDAVLWVLEGNARAIRFYGAGGWRADGARALDCWGATSVPRLRFRRRLSRRPPG